MYNHNVKKCRDLPCILCHCALCGTIILSFDKLLYRNLRNNLGAIFFHMT